MKFYIFHGNDFSKKYYNHELEAMVGIKLDKTKYYDFNIEDVFYGEYYNEGIDDFVEKIHYSLMDNPENWIFVSRIGHTTDPRHRITYKLTMLKEYLNKYDLHDFFLTIDFERSSDDDNYKIVKGSLFNVDLFEIGQIKCVLHENERLSNYKNEEKIFIEAAKVVQNYFKEEERNSFE